jgi:hypothetical protein
MQLRLVDYRAQTDKGGVQLHFVSDNPAPYAMSDFYVFLTDAEANVASANTLQTTLTNKLQRTYGAAVDVGGGEMVGQGITNLNGLKNTNFTVTT